MPNKSNISPAERERRFIDDVARLLVPWGVPLMAARLYGYLLLRAEPVTLDRITIDLQVSKSSASVAARLLEQYTLARRHGERGSKRVLYEAADDYEKMLSEQNRLLEALADVLRAGTRVAASRRTRDRLADMAAFCSTIRQAMELSARRRRAKRRPSPRPTLGRSARLLRC